MMKRSSSLSIILTLFIVYMPQPSSLMITSLIKITTNHALKSLINREVGMIHLRPVPYKTPNVSLVIWKGYGIDPNNYRDFSHNIQQYGKLRNLNIEVFIPKHNTIPHHTNSKNIFLFGHSSGGYDALKINHPDIKATVTYGATHNSKRKLYMGIGKIPKPLNKSTLTMIGERDGYISYRNILDEFPDPQNRSTHNALVIRGTNHLCISNNQTNSICRSLKLNDLPQYPLFTLEDASKRIASVLVDYILYKMRKDPFFLKYVQNTSQFLKYVETMSRLDRMVLPVMIKASIDLHTCIIDSFKSFWRFLLSKPTPTNGKVFRNDDRSTIWIKMHRNNTHTPIDLQASRVKQLYNSILRPQNISISKVSYRRCSTTLEWLLRKPKIIRAKSRNVLHPQRTIVTQFFTYKQYIYIKVPSILSICETCSV